MILAIYLKQMAITSQRQAEDDKKEITGIL